MRKIFKFAMCAVALLMATDVVMAQTADKNILTNVFRREKANANGALPEAFLKCRVETLKEPGCERYEIYQSCEDPTIFFIYEIWTTEEAHRQHNATPHVKIHSQECRGIYEPDFKGDFKRVFIE